MGGFSVAGAIVLALIGIGIYYGSQKMKKIDIGKLKKYLKGFFIFYVSSVLIGFVAKLILRGQMSSGGSVNGILYSIYRHPMIAELIFIGIGFFLYKKYKRYQEEKEYKEVFEEWTHQDFPTYDRWDFIHSVARFVKGELQFVQEEIPYGRAAVFLQEFSLDETYDLEFLAYEPIRSKEKIELKEYGCLITTEGIAIKHQAVYPKKKAVQLENGKEKNQDYFPVESYYLPYEGMMKITGHSTCFMMLYSDGKRVNLPYDQLPIPAQLLQKIFEEIILRGYSQTLYRESLEIKSKVDERKDKNVGEQDIPVNEIDEDELREPFEKGQHNEFQKKVAGTLVGSQVVNPSSTNSLASQLKEQQFNQMVNGRQGHGVAAEYGNHVVDKVMGKNAIQLGGENSKNGADRLVNRQAIQTKYCQSANESIGAAFKDKNGHAVSFKYTNQMIEVPRDQYVKAVELFEKRIEKGQVPGESNPANAKKYVKKGHLTYEHAKQVGKAGTIPSLGVDTVGAVKSTLPSASLLLAVSYFNCRGQGMSHHESMKQSGAVFGRSLGVGVVINVSAIQAAKYMAGKSSVKDPGVLTARIGTGIMMSLTFGPDTVDVLRGRISIQQLFKNSVVSVSGILGSTAGSSVGGLVGGMAGGSAASSSVKKLLDSFIEDDAEEMYQLMKEEFIDVVMSASITAIEYQEVVSLTFANKKFPGMLKNMYASRDPRTFAREKICEEAIITQFKNRGGILEKEWEEVFIKIQ